MYRFKRVRDDRDMDLWLKLRTAVYLASGFLTQSDVNDAGIYVDQYDAYSEHVLAVDDTGLVVGSARLIVRQNGEPLQVEKEFNITVEAVSAEISGLAVVAARRGSAVTAGLVRAVLEIAREGKIDRVYAEVEDDFLRHLNRFGFPLAPMTETRFVFNTFNRVATASVDNF